MSDTVPATSPAPAPKRTSGRRPARRGPSLRLGQTQREGITLLVGIVALMWIVEVINAIDGYGLDNDGIYPRDVGRLWAIFTAPFIHENFAPHLLDNTIPFVFMGLIIALRGAARLAAVTLIVIIVGGLGTWLVAPAHTVTIGASGVVFGYATYLLVRGLFDRSALEVLTGIVVGVIWGGVLLASIVPHTGVSWQGHVAGAVGGVVAAYLLRRERPDTARLRRGAGSAAGAGAGTGASAGALPG